MPSAWNGEDERKFFEGIAERGLASASDVISSSAFPGDLPKFLAKESSIVKRIQQLHEISKKRPPSDRPPPKPAKPRTRRQTRPSLEDFLSGNFKLPICITPSSQLISLGQIVTDRPAFHTTRYIYPVGYKTSRMYKSPLNPKEKMVWYSEIQDDGTEFPLFVVTASGDETAVFTGRAPTAPWAHAIHELATRFHSKEKTISGPVAFLLSSPIVTLLIEHLPGASECHGYKMKNPTDLSSSMDRCGQASTSKPKQKPKKPQFGESDEESSGSSDSESEHFE
jgi:chromodomain-helicase-DNA-binding protein 7